jgi:hypothetical protein
VAYELVKPNLPTENAAVKLTLYSSLLKKMHVGGLFCDLARALDCVNHEIVLAMLHFYGLITVGAKWFSSYLANIKQR